ncbi:hypothetical protein [Komagataeibacter swingsii]|uniref:Uncharacterized protein n=1 Tax=Komagataeibacter swingsii TaxID=215220 RepID=A0A2V4QXV5_9PROT|nr:hypothetical protein [Komagataeibacter swingsii]PYD69411.1 hypothetical protein CFR76_10040 [Komagataeibacter swingsii]GBQ65790.1 hypothetical protein AA16373_3158 [Komagataeibacter swingsii DSM 16373]
MTSTTNTLTRYVQYRTTDGYVVQAFTWLGAPSFPAGAGYAFVADAANAYTPGNTYATLAVSSAYALSGPATAMAGSAVTLALTPNNSGPGADVTVTLSDGGAGGTFSADTVTFGAGKDTAQSVTYTPKAAGPVTISATNSGGLTNPASLSVTVAAATA